MELGPGSVVDCLTIRALYRMLVMLHNQKIFIITNVQGLNWSLINLVPDFSLVLVCTAKRLKIVLLVVVGSE